MGGGQLAPEADRFFVQEAAREMWHVETREDCELMLCGLLISIDVNARVQTRWGPRRCPDCWYELEVKKTDL